MSSAAWFTVLIALVGVERLGELVVARRNLAWSLAQGGKEFGQGHYPVMVLLHTGLLLGCLAEVWGLQRAFDPVVGWPCLGVALLTQLLRWWCIRTLGPRWNTRVVVVPGLPRIEGGPYRVFPHPNYVAVVSEGLALPLIHGAWITALAFTALNLPLLAVRIRCEERALREVCG